MRFLGAPVAIVGVLLVLLGAFGVSAAILGSLDPVEAMFSNDHGPLGTARSSAEHLFMGSAYMVAGVFGFYMVRWG